MHNHTHKEGFQKCRYCDYYVRNALLPQHERIHKEFSEPKENLKVKTFQCSIGPYQSKIKRGLKQHAERKHLERKHFYIKSTKIMYD